MSKFKFDLIASNFKKNETLILKEVANNVVKYSLRAFKRQAWLSKEWKEVKRRIPGTSAYKYPKKRGLSRRTKPILTGKGTLRRAVNNSVKGISSRKIRFEINLPYASIHNEGGIMKNGRRMPKRQYFGFTRELSKETADIIKKWADRSFKTR